MTFYHFVNCAALAYVPFYLVYKFSGLSEYGAFWKCVTAGGGYMGTQLIKMLVLATLFSSDYDLDFEEDNALPDPDVPFSFINEFLKVSLELVDVVGLYFILQQIAGKGQVKVLSAGLGWGFAEFLFTKLIFLWMGARGIEFDWKYIQKSFDANMNMVHYITLTCLVWIYMRKDLNKTLLPILCVLVAACSYQSLFLEAVVHLFSVGAWTALIYKGVTTLTLGLITLQLYIGVTASDKY